MTDKEKLERLKKIKVLIENVMQLALIDEKATLDDMKKYIAQLEKVEDEIRALEKKLNK
ncbi:MAG: hypothetical protein MUE81_07150 [Thermoflexibacter sp.]|jgi:hypothetical protein|nr:hypothetical protein [Thermoflexibacter sp.]